MHIGYRAFITLQGCVDAVVDTISEQIGVIAGVSIAIAVLLVRYVNLYAIYKKISREKFVTQILQIQ